MLEHLNVTDFDPTFVANIESIRNTLQVLELILTQSGVGALPLLTETNADGSLKVLEEGEIGNRTSSLITELYARQKQLQDANAVVASLLTAPDGTRPR